LLLLLLLLLHNSCICLWMQVADSIAQHLLLQLVMLLRRWLCQGVLHKT
jgi:hypothetical protein